MRGVTSIVAIVLLIAIAVIAGISIYFWVSGTATRGTDSNHQGPFDRVVVRGGRPYYVDWMAVAKYVSPEPSLTFSNEEAL